MLPGFIPRLHSELARLLSPPTPNLPFGHPTTTLPSSSPPHTPTATRTRIISSSPASTPSPSRRPSYDPYAPLRPLAPFIAIVNNPIVPSHLASKIAGANTGKAPAFAPAILPWVGGSLAGYVNLKKFYIHYLTFDGIDVLSHRDNAGRSRQAARKSYASDGTKRMKNPSSHHQVLRLMVLPQSSTKTGLLGEQGKDTRTSYPTGREHP